MSGEAPTSSQDSVNDGSEGMTAEDLDQHQKEAVSLDSDSQINENQKVVAEAASSSDVTLEETETSTTPLSKPPDNEARLEQLEKEHETLRSQYMRIAADFDNFRKRQSRDHEDLRLQLTCNTLSEILPIVDNFERARQQLEPQGEEAQALHRSYQGLYKQLVDVLKQLGVAPMRVVGQAFDPSLHEAVLREPSDAQVEDTITEELQRGYHLNGHVLRHALVKVSMGPGPKEQTLGDSNDESDAISSIENDDSSNQEL